MGKRLIEIVDDELHTVHIEIDERPDARPVSLYILYFIWKSNISPPPPQLIDKARALASLSNWLDEFDGFIICRLGPIPLGKVRNKTTLLYRPTR
jgi:hypothetical protein